MNPKLRLYNIKKGKEEVFVPYNSEHIKMYVCGPTVYDDIHVGNARNVVVFDVLYRILCFYYPHVQYVRNLTDVDDKIVDRSLQLHISPQQLTEHMIQAFHKITNQLNCLSPDCEPKASDHIEHMIRFIETLITKNFAYTLEGNVLFNTQAFPQYLEFLATQSLEYGKRIELDALKENPHDFYLWKKISKDSFGYESPWGHGRPGWHTECAVMSIKYLGSSFDIHGGGMDLMFPHHHNEWTQARCLGHKFAKTWVYNGFINDDGEKMSKSLGNIACVKDVVCKYSGMTLRLYLLQTHYSKPSNFSDKGLQAAETLLIRFMHFYVRAMIKTNHLQDKDDVLSKNMLSKLKPLPDVITAIADNLNVPLAIRCIVTAMKQYEQQKEEVLFLQIRASLMLLGLDLQPFVVPQEEIIENDSIRTLLKQREKAKITKNFATADSVRQQLQKQNILLEDTQQGVLLISLQKLKDSNRISSV